VMEQRHRTRLSKNTQIIALFVLIGVIIFLWWQVLAQNNASQFPKQSSNTVPVDIDITKVPDSSTKISDIADWKTFKSEWFDYSVSYPANWPIFRFSTNLTADSIIEFFYLNREKDKRPKTEEPYINIFGNFQGSWCDGNTDPNICLQKEVELGGKKAKKWLNTIDYDEIYLVDLTKDKSIVIFVNYGGNKNLTDQILSTFKFNDQ